MSDERPTLSFTAPPRPGVASPTAETILDLTVPHEPSVVAAELEKVDAHDAARMLMDLPADRAGEVVPLLPPEQVARIVTEMDPGRAARVLGSMSVEDATAVLARLNPDDRVDILDELDEAKHDQLVAGLDAEDRAEVLTLEQYPPDTAGGIMTTDVTYLYQHLTVANAIDQLRRFHEELEQMFYVYVIDTRHHLVGVLSMRDLILARPEQKLREIMILRDRVRALPAEMD